jgi:hypothetical protein
MARAELCTSTLAVFKLQPQVPLAGAAPHHHPTPSMRVDNHTYYPRMTSLIKPDTSAKVCETLQCR